MSDPIPTSGRPAEPDPTGDERSSPRGQGRWTSRWEGLARAAHLEPTERLVVALSGGADSVYLATVIGEARPRVDAHLVHVRHHLRGDESRGDAEHCRALAERLQLPYRELDAPVESGPGLEERARRARYAALLTCAKDLAADAVLTAHHADDALETLLWRWIRGTAVEGLGGARRELELPSGFGVEDANVRLVRPLAHLRREEVRSLLEARGIAWREDSSNRDPVHTRSRIRHGLLPELERLFGRGAVENLTAFGRAVEDLETALAGRTAHLHWRRPRHLGFTRTPLERGGGVLERAPLMRLPRPLRRRVLRRLVTEGTGRAPGQRLLEGILHDLGLGRCTRHSLPGRWVLWMRSDQLVLVAPTQAPGAALEAAREQPERASLPVPGRVELEDGRTIVSSWADGSHAAPPTGGLAVELDARALPDELDVAWPEPGDRFHALGAPGSKKLRRYLANRGVPRETRASVPVVRAGDEIVWVAGLEPCERHRVRDLGARRLRLELIESDPV